MFADIIAEKRRRFDLSYWIKGEIVYEALL